MESSVWFRGQPWSSGTNQIEDSRLLSRWPGAIARTGGKGSLQDLGLRETRPDLVERGRKDAPRLRLGRRKDAPRSSGARPEDASRRRIEEDPPKRGWLRLEDPPRERLPGLLSSLQTSSPPAAAPGRQRAGGWVPSCGGCECFLRKLLKSKALCVFSHRSH